MWLNWKMSEWGAVWLAALLVAAMAAHVPSAPPTDLKVEALDQHSLKVTWKPPPPQDWNGDIQGYYVGFKLSSSDNAYVFETVDISKETGKEHHLQIGNLKTYTQYSVVVQSFNKMGQGPISEDMKIYTAEGVPSAPPHDALCTTLTAQTIRVSWVSPPLASANGVIKGYKVIYGPSDSWYDEKSKDTKVTSSNEIILHGLKKHTNYSMEVLATTSGGDGVRSTPIHCQTEQDVPEAPTAVKALVMSLDSILVSWRAPTQPNGIVTHYTVYTQMQGSEPVSNKVPALQMSYSATDLKSARYHFWVTASTVIGEGQPSPTVSTSPNTKVPAKVASFDDSFTSSYKEDVKLPCLAVGVPPPSITWKVKGAPLETSDRVRQLPEGSLLIAGVAREDAGDYTCFVENPFGTDTVTHNLTVHAPPFPPAVALASSNVSSLSLRLRPVNGTPTHGYTIHYKQEFGDWETVQVSSQATTYTLENLYCGSRYQVYVTAYNSIGTGEGSDVLNARTRGSKPIVPRAADFMEVSSGSVTLHLKQWQDGGCRMSHFVVENKKKGAAEWNQISNNVKPGGNFVVLDLEPATWYLLRITAHNNAGFNVAEYEFATLTVTGELEEENVTEEERREAEKEQKAPERKFTVKGLSKGLHLLNKLLTHFEEMDPNIERFERIERMAHDVFQPYREIYEEKKKQTIQSKLTMFMQKKHTSDK